LRLSKPGADVPLEFLPQAQRLNHYAAYGLPFVTAERIPGLSSADAASSEEMPVAVEIGEVPTELDGAEARDDLVQSNGSEYLFDWPEILRLLVQDGRRVRAEAMPGRDPLHFWYNVLSLGASLAGFQRGYYPLHASAVVADGAAIAFAGPPGAGKSTLLAGLTGRGFPLLSDDLCLIRDAGGRNLVGAGPPDLRLLPDAVERLDLDRACAVPAEAAVRKTVFRLGDAEQGDVPLRRVYTLAFSPDDGDPTIRRLSGWATMQALIYNNRMCMRLDRLPAAVREGAFAAIARLAQTIAIYAFERPCDHDRFDQSLDLLVAHMAEAETGRG
jgi:hypothetical protein